MSDLDWIEEKQLCQLEEENSAQPCMSDKEIEEFIGNWSGYSPSDSDQLWNGLLYAFRFVGRKYLDLRQQLAAMTSERDAAVKSRDQWEAYFRKSEETCGEICKQRDAAIRMAEESESEVMRLMVRRVQADPPTRTPDWAHE